MDAALDAGINYFDTANVYGWGENKRRTESIIGNWFAKGGERRDKVVLATKVYGCMGADDTAWPNHERLSAVNIRRAADASLKRLQTDHIDIYQFHHIDRNTPFEEIWQDIDLLVQQVKIPYVGSCQVDQLPLLVGEMPPARHDRLPTGSAFQTDPVRQPVRTARRDNWCPVVGSAGP
ncbi:hypothetical protein GCM10018780_26110 [Streptomyces lanatus]|nr:hypothetical protein GCM10018780_26110 [Streptomyces lanatus]